MSVSICIDEGQITKEFLESLKTSEEKSVPLVTIDELATACEETFDLYAEPLKVYLFGQERKLQERR